MKERLKKERNVHQLLTKIDCENMEKPGRDA